MRNLKNPSEIIDSIQHQLPALYFVFGRAKSETLAVELGMQWDFLDINEKKRVKQIIIAAEAEYPDMFVHRDRSTLKKLLVQGIGYHHAGLSMGLKRIVERLYEERLIWVLFCTETFAAGVNFPAASTVFESCRKWDGREFRQLLNREFFQMAGRAGRRGFDQHGHVFIQISDSYPAETGFFKESGIEKVQGRLTVSANTVLNLLMWKSDQEIEHFLKSNFSAFQKRRNLKETTKDIAEAQIIIQEKNNVFCEDRENNTCPLISKKLKRELQKLKSRKYRQIHGSSNRITEIKKTLKILNQKHCNSEKCFEAVETLRKVNQKLLSLQLKKKKTAKETQRYTADFNKMRRLLERLGYVDGRVLFSRGKFALHLHIQEIFVAELVFSGILENSPPDVVAGILAGVDYVPGRREFVKDHVYNIDPVTQLRAELTKLSVPQEYLVWSPVPGYIVSAWYQGQDFAHLLENTSLQEGDIISIIRREIDLLRQIEKAIMAGGPVSLKENNSVLLEKIRNIKRTLDRDQMMILL
ncbi:MAG: RNA helicase [Desulfotomaculum sp.]|nr:RNA helicase [Desulfotomaculum sp.]